MNVSKVLEDSLRKQVTEGGPDVQQGWILADGTILDLLYDDGENPKWEEGDHMGTAMVALREAGLPVDGGTDKTFALMLEKTGAIRVCSYNYTMLHLLVVPTPAQVDACAEIARYTKSEESDAGMEVFWEPEDRLVQIYPLTAGRLRKTLEALPGLPKGK